jgi:hypothetical protein
MGGSDDPSNIIELTIEEHAEAHRKLYEKYGRIEDKLAWKGLAGLIGKDEILLELAKLRGPKISRANKGKIPWNKDLKCAPLSEEHKRKISESSKGHKKSKNHAKNVSKALTGVSKSIEHKKSISESLEGNIPWNKGKTNVQKAWNKGKSVAKDHYCKYCGNNFDKGNYNRWHGDKCKEKPL